MSSFPAFGSIKSFQDVKMALDRIRAWFIEVAPPGDVKSGTTNVTDSHLVEFQGPTGKQIKDGGLSHAEVAAALAYIGSLGMAITYRDNVQPAEIDEANEKILRLVLRPRVPDFSAEIEEIRDELARLVGRPRENPTWENRIASLENGVFRFSGVMDDDESITGPLITSASHGSITICYSGAVETSAEWEMGASGDVELIRSTVDTVCINIADPGTDGKFNLGIGSTNPPVFKNRLGGAREPLILIWH